MNDPSSGRIRVIAGNWKMHKTIEEAVSFVRELIPSIQNLRVKIYLAVPYTSIRFAADAAKNSPLCIGAENMSDETEGAFTGEISARMLKNAGAKFVLLGHSERRHIFNESDAFIHRKVKKAISENIEIIFCVGETGEERKTKKTEEVLKRQLEESLGDLTAEQIATLILAYEPVWAIGSGHSAHPADVQAMHYLCRQWVKHKWGQETAQKVVILYGGSVHPDDVKNFIQLPDVDGVLVGGASLSVASFSTIIQESNPAD